MSDFKLKAVQLDVARQMETVEFIKGFIDMLAANGYNALMLYLEDRVRTASYPYPAEGEAYTEDEIRSLVRYGAEKGIELFPCVATLGHAERFLRHKELEKFSEVQEGMIDRFGNKSVKNAFCINHPEFYDFIGTYLTEIAALFPSVWFHAGLDEFWNFNLCDRCRKVMHCVDDEEKAFIAHIKRIREILAKCGKRMLMWSDMFEFYPHYMAGVPKDVVMIDWQYQNDVRFYHSHLLDQEAEDRHARNEKLGLDTIFAPADRPFSNAVSYLHYAENRKALGFMVTSWEKSDTFLYRSFPLFCTIGRMLNGDSLENAYAGAVKYLFGTDDKVLAETMKAAASLGFWRHFAELGDTTLFARPYIGTPKALEHANDSLIALWETCKDKITTDIGHRIWRDVRYALEEKQIGFRLKSIFQDAVDSGYRPVMTEQANAVYKQTKQVLSSFAEEWKNNRPGIGPNMFEKRSPELLEKLQKHIDLLPVLSMVKTRFCLPDQYGIPYLKITVHTEKGWQVIVPRKAFKADSTEDALYEYAVIEKIDGTPDMIRYELHGMGGQGICFSEVRDSSGNSYVPYAVSSVQGTVEHPEFMLANDVNFAWFGSQSTRTAYNEKGIANQIHAVTLLLKKA